MYTTLLSEEAHKIYVSNKDRGVDEAVAMRLAKLHDRWLGLDQ